MSIRTNKDNGLSDPTIERGEVILTKAEIEHITTILGLQIQDRKPIIENLPETDAKRILLEVDSEFMQNLIDKLFKIKLSSKEKKQD